VVVSSIEQIEARTYTTDPLINGTLLGAGIGAVAGLLLSTVCIGCEYYTGDEQKIVVGGALFGALVGFTADLAREDWHWRLLWRRPE
jgi:hypothetical protein